VRRDDRSETWIKTFCILTRSQALVSAKDKVTRCIRFDRWREYSLSSKTRFVGPMQTCCSKRQLDTFICFCWAHGHDQQTESQTNHATRSVAKGRNRMLSMRCSLKTKATERQSPGDQFTKYLTIYHKIKFVVR